jgi:hypothetical protein
LSKNSLTGGGGFTMDFDARTTTTLGATQFGRPVGALLDYTKLAPFPPGGNK